jgi:hypothetical protein
MLPPNDFRRLVIRPVLERLSLWSLVAQELLLGTALQESGLDALVQRGGGPALGVYQIEPATHQDVWDNYLRYHDGLMQAVLALTAPWPDRRQQLITNLVYATAIARLIYLRHPDPLPDVPDPDALGAYWKRVYNTSLGAGVAAEYADKYRRFSGAP